MTMATVHRPDATVDEVEVRCPVRVSLGGGGTDVLSYAGRYGSAIVSLAIDRYISLHVRRASGNSSSVRLAPDTAHGGAAAPLRLISRVLETVDPVCRYDVELSSEHDFGSGLGSSSSLVVALLRAVEAFHGEDVGPAARAREAFRVERVLLGEAGGFQDHLAAAYGGFHHYRFSSLTSLRVTPVTGQLAPIVGALAVCGSGVTRSSSTVLAGQLRRVAAEEQGAVRLLHRIRLLADEVLAAIAAGDIEWFARCVDAGWRLKRALNPLASTPPLEALIRAGREAGALGARVLGAGAGGHVLFVVPPGRQGELRQCLAATGRTAFPVRVAPAGAAVRYVGPVREPDRRPGGTVLIPAGPGR
jgi:D-glycero-alpha-D-manno-heptose-7-phosphate kinase